MNELLNLNKLRLKKHKSKTLGKDFNQKVSKVQFYQFLKIHKTLEKAMLHHLYDSSIDLKSVLRIVIQIIP